MKEILDLSPQKIFSVWYRNFTVYRKIFASSLLPNFIEPLLYLLAMGFGLCTYVSKIGSLTYFEFLVPGLIISTSMFAASFECTFAAFVRMYYQKTYEAILAAPVTVADIVAGEILWGASKTLLYGTIYMITVVIMGVDMPRTFYLVPLLIFFTGLLFSSLGMIFTAFVPAIDNFNYYFTLAVTPMFLFSGIVFPLDKLHPLFQKIIYISPLTHCVAISRMIFGGSLDITALYHFLWLLALTAIFYISASALMIRRLKKD